MIQQKLSHLKKLISDLDEQKLSHKKLDSISLISENLSRPKGSSIINVKDSKVPPMLKNKKHSMVQTFEVPQFTKTTSIKLVHKAQSLRDPSPFDSPTRFSPSPRKFNTQYLNQAIKNKLTTLARKLYEARNEEMGLKFSQTVWQQFLRNFLLKNSQAQQLKKSKIDLSGLGLVGNLMKIGISMVVSYQSIDLSRNVLCNDDVLNLGKSLRIQQLILKNCGMRNQQLCTLFTLLLQTPIRRLCLSSPDVKDRNNLTKYQQLYRFIEGSTSLECLQLSNIQISPDNQIFSSVKKSKSLIKLDLSKNTGVTGICKNIHDLNLSWNSISSPFQLKCNESEITKLDLTGNIIRSHLFEDFLINNNFPQLQTLILNKIAINQVGDWLQIFLERTKSLLKLSLVQCQLTKTTFLNLAYGLEMNKTLKYLNVSGNKFPNKGVAQQFAQALQKSVLSHLQMQLCDIKDESGSILFGGLENNSHIQYIDVSKNNLSHKTSEKICEHLKKGCYNLLVLITTQNFIKYIQLKQIVGYISRNVYMAKVKVKEQYKKYKNMNANTTELLRSINKAEQKIDILMKQTLDLEKDFMQRQLETDKIKADVLQQKIRLLNEEEQILQKKKAKLQQELAKLTTSNLSFQNQSRLDLTTSNN